MKFPIGADGQSRPSVPAIAADVANTNRGAHDFAKNCWSDPCPGAILLEKRPDESNDAGRGMDETRERRMDHTLVCVLITSLVACAPAWAGDQELDVFGAPRGGDTTYAGGISAHGAFADCDALQAEASEAFSKCQADTWDCIRGRIGDKRASLLQHGVISQDWEIPFQCGGEVVTKMFFGAVYSATPAPDEPVGSIRRD